MDDLKYYVNLNIENNKTEKIRRSVFVQIRKRMENMSFKNKQECLGLIASCLLKYANEIDKRELEKIKRWLDEN